MTWTRFSARTPGYADGSAKTDMPTQLVDLRRTSPTRQHRRLEALRQVLSSK